MNPWNDPWNDSIDYPDGWFSDTLKAMLWLWVWGAVIGGVAIGIVLIAALLGVK